MDVRGSDTLGVEKVKKVLVVIGTRPEAIKMAPLIHMLNDDFRFELKICSTGQHKELLDDAMASLEIVPDFELNVMTQGGTLNDITSNIFSKISKVFSSYKPELVLVHGDTTTSFAAAVSAYYVKIPVAHIEAGLRTNDIYSPWPEEVNRKIIASVACLHFAPTEVAKKNLLAEGVNEGSIFVTGNTIVDCLNLVLDGIDKNSTLKSSLVQKFQDLTNGLPLILVTSHRRENFGLGLEQICDALKKIAEEYPRSNIVFPLHLNPSVKKPVTQMIGNLKNIYIIEPLDYVSFVYLMSKANLILTDSGGIQEEAPSLGKPIILMRENTERPEVLTGGTAKMTGANSDKIVDAVQEYMCQQSSVSNSSKAVNPFGDGKACERIIAQLAVYL